MVTTVLRSEIFSFVNENIRESHCNIVSVLIK